MGKITQNDFIKIGDRYLLKNSNSLYVDETEMQRMIMDSTYLGTGFKGKRKNKKEVTENETEPIATDVVEKTVTTKK